MFFCVFFLGLMDEGVIGFTGMLTSNCAYLARESLRKTSLG